MALETNFSGMDAAFSKFESFTCKTLRQKIAGTQFFVRGARAPHFLPFFVSWQKFCVNKFYLPENGLFR